MRKVNFYVFMALASLTLMSSSCDNDRPQQKSDSGVSKATIKVNTDENGHTIEQRNIMDRLVRDNAIGEVKHLYIISSYSGDVMEYSTVVGKVTSGSKRLSPKTVDNASGFNGVNGSTNTVYIGGIEYYTDEVLDDGGTYGESGNYLFWFDAQGNYHQYYPSGGTYLHISEKPLRVRKANMTFVVE